MQINEYGATLFIGEGKTLSRRNEKGRTESGPNVL
jgi:hypothetical protein